MILRTAFALATWSLCALGCALRSEDPAPLDMAITLKFPSPTAPIPVEKIELRVFDASGQQDACTGLLATLRTGDALPTALVDKTDNICAYHRGEVAVPTPLGAVALLAVGFLPSGEEAFSGCVQQILGEGRAAALPITMSRSGNPDLTVSAGACASLEQLCGPGC